MTKKIIIPTSIELQDSFFFSKNNQFEINEEDLSILNLKHPFLYEAAYYSAINALKPWEDGNVSISEILTEWAVTKVILEEAFKNRDRKAALAPMKHGIALFIQCLFWANEVPVKLNPAIGLEGLKLKPVNVQERLDFILAKPNLYHSFMQLVELMTEIEKQYGKRLALKKIGK